MPEPEPQLAPFPEDWGRALVVVAHPDDMEYGGASAVARWVGQGKDVRYVLVTSGEAGISTMSPDEALPLREAEQRASCAAVGVDTVEFLGFPDGLVEANLDLRRALAGAIRRHRPDVVVATNFREHWPGGHGWNHVDHRAVGESLLDSVRDAANPWIFTDQGEAWEGCRFVAFSSSPRATHWVDIDDWLPAGIESLECHKVYLASLQDGTNPPDMLRKAATAAAVGLPVDLACTFEVVGT